MKTAKFILPLTLLLLAGCAADSEKTIVIEPEKNAPVLKPAPIVPATKAVPEASGKNTEAKTPSAEKKTPPPAPAVRKKTVEPVVKFRCAYWSRPTGTPAELYFKSGNDFKKISSPPVMLFHSESDSYFGELPIKVFRKRPTPSGAASEYEWLFSIDPQGKKDISVVILPDKIREILGRGAVVFDRSLETFPNNTICFVNFSGCELSGNLEMRGSADSQNFSLKNGESFVSRVFPDGRTTYDVRFDTKSGEEMHTVFASSGSFYSGLREMIFIIPRDGTNGEEGALPELEFRSIKERISSTAE